MANVRNICTLCNYIYEEIEGERGESIDGSIPFSKLPADWQCPECGGNKEFFQPCSCVSLDIYENTCVSHRKHHQAACC